MCISTRPPGHLWGVPAPQTLSAGPRAWLQPVALTDADLVCAGATHVVRGCLCAHGGDIQCSNALLCPSRPYNVSLDPASAPTVHCWPHGATSRRGEIPMQAVAFTQTGPPDVLHILDVPDPSPGPGQVRIQVKV